MPAARCEREKSTLLASLVMASTLAAASVAVPAQLVLTAVGLLLVLTGAAVGMYGIVAGRRRGSSNQVPLDVAGILVLFGFAAAIMSDKSEAMMMLSELAGALGAAAEAA